MPIGDTRCEVREEAVAAAEGLAGPRAKLPTRGLFLMPFFQLLSSKGKKSPKPLRNQDWHLIMSMALW
ncbi:hypothetical protein BJQ97_01381 [Geobacillus sp. TFV-3]|nr:hypothetical protein BJQ97_01381 [Geobacillus sp. TFV-3]